MNKAFIFGIALLAPLAFAGKPHIDHGVVKSVGKRGAPVHLTHTANYAVKVGERVAVALPLVLDQDAQNVRVEVHADKGLALSQPWLKFDLGPQSAGALDLPAINVTVMNAGRRSLNATVYVQNGGSEMFRSFSVPLATAGAKAATVDQSRLKTEPGGRKLRIMRATQTNE
ncbi:MAG: hypothetical protein AB8G16_09525 [Gammaproteobacteria bacterium]